MCHSVNIPYQSITSMNSSLDMIFPGIEYGDSQVVFKRIEKEAAKLETLLSCYDTEAETYQVNLKAREGWVTVSHPLWKILKECVYYNHLTLGYFDIGLKFFKQNPTLIHHNDRPELYGISSIEFRNESQSIRFQNKTTSIDFGAIGKGLLLKEIDKILTEFGVKHCFISFGGSSILTRGTHPHGTSWPVTLRNSSGDHNVFHLNNDSASFSGAILESSFGETYHIVHPKRLEMIQSKRLTFVQCKCPVLAEVLSTSLVAADTVDIPKIISNANPIKAHVF